MPPQPPEALLEEAPTTDSVVETHPPGMIQIGAELVPIDTLDSHGVPTSQRVMTAALTIGAALCARRILK